MLLFSLPGFRLGEDQGLQGSWGNKFEHEVGLGPWTKSLAYKIQDFYTND